ncbi:MAG TPA: tRNA pseudouridine(55) synthase TruB [Pyrinomonadaceae bacterium]|nr:tRNA pseudouridine(55) synthase TruB [Pyrinomonadaceae bacterium]
MRAILDLKFQNAIFKSPSAGQKSKIVFVDGIIIIDKPAGLTSHDVVARVRRILRMKRVGHTGTLDPFATGVLVVLLGRATRLAQFLSGALKEYEAVVHFGYATDTGDVTGKAKDVQGPRSEVPSSGQLTERFGPWTLDLGPWTLDEIEAALASLRGEIEQVPPMYSAKKVGGEKLYELARRGELIERKAARVTIHELEIIAHEGATLSYQEDGTCDLNLRVVCSAGTYIRVLAEEIGERLGTRAHLAALRRTRAGSFKIASAVTLDQLEERSLNGEWASFLISPAMALPELPSLHLTGEEARCARHGVGVRVGRAASASWREGEQVRMLSEGAALIAVGVYDTGLQTLRPRIVIQTEE